MSTKKYHCRQRTDLRFPAVVRSCVQQTMAFGSDGFMRERALAIRTGKKDIFAEKIGMPYECSNNNYWCPYSHLRASESFVFFGHAANKITFRGIPQKQFYFTPSSELFQECKNIIYKKVNFAKKTILKIYFTLFEKIFTKTDIILKIILKKG